MTRSVTVTISPKTRGPATRFATSNGFTPVRVALMRTTAATGDMVRPAADATDTTAPTAAGSCPAATAGSWKNPYRLWVLAIPDPLIAANAHGTAAASGTSSPGDPAINSPRADASPAFSSALPKQLAVTIRLTMTANP